MLLSVLVPVWNERATIENLLQQVQNVPLDLEIIVVDNVSDDGTRQWLESLIARGEAISAHENDDDNSRLRVWFQTGNLGKGASVKRALSLARGDWVIVQDADLEYDPNDYVKLLAAAKRHQTRAKKFGSHAPIAVFGTRLRDAQTRDLQGRGAFFWGRVGLSVLFRLLYARPVSDVATCYKLMPRALVQSLDLQSDGFDLDFEIPARLVRRGVRIIEVPISYAPRSRAQGKKISPLRDGWGALRAFIRFRLF